MVNEHDSENLDALMQRSECLFSQDEVKAAIANIARAVTEDLSHRNPIVLCVMNGGLIFTSELMQRLPFALQLDYLHCSRYHNTHSGAAELLWYAQPKLNLGGRHVLVVDDILDEGLTLNAIVDHCEKQRAASTRVAVLVQKDHSKLKANMEPNYCGLVVPDRYVFGYGMDSQGYWRNLPGIYAFIDNNH